MARLIGRAHLQALAEQIDEVAPRRHSSRRLPGTPILNAGGRAIHPKAMPAIRTTDEERDVWVRVSWGDAKVLRRPFSDDVLVMRWADEEDKLALSVFSPSAALPLRGRFKLDDLVLGA